MNRYGLITILCLLISSSGFGQLTYDQRIQVKVNQVQGLSTDLLKFESFGIKNDGSKGLENTLNWLESRYSDMNNMDIFKDSFIHPLSSNINVNLIVEKKGTDGSAPWIIITSHYDTRSGPGVNDNGTGVAASLKMAELLADVSTRNPVRFIHFAGEEEGYFGSKHYVDNVLGINASVLLVINLDQLGGTKGGSDNDKIVCERDESLPDFNNLKSWSYTDTLSQAIELYTSLQTTTGKAFNSDYMPFQDKGYVITGLWQFNGLQYPFYHTSGDSLIHVDTNATIEVTKGALAAVLHFSRATGFVNARGISKGSATVYPNPASRSIYIDLPPSKEYNVLIYNFLGEIVKTDTLQRNSNKLDIDLGQGMYLIKAIDKENSAIFSGKFVVRD